MDNRGEVREFLVSRRAKVSPEQAGIAPGTDRRVPGLRRSEVALLAGMSVEYYTRLERGTLAGVSDSVLHFGYEALEVTEDPGLQFMIYTAQPGTDTAERLALLGSWAASQTWASPTAPKGVRALRD